MRTRIPGDRPGDIKRTRRGLDPGKRDFDKSAKGWERDAARLKMTSTLADALIARLTWGPDLLAMDYGAGTGLVTLRIQPLVGRVLAVDTSAGMLSVVQGKVAEAGLPNVAVRLWNIETDPLPEERFDVVVSTMTFHHLKDIPQALGRFHELLRTGGRIAVADLDAEAGDFHAAPAGVWHFGFDRKELEDEFRAAGFRRVRTETAYRLERPGAGGKMKEFRLFLLTAIR
jgi:ubiquinone/menaquinone biosynthesis C-methylase UbiE